MGWFFLWDKVVKLVGGGSVINRAYPVLLADAGEAKGSSTNSLVINWLIHSVSQSPFSSHSFTAPPCPNGSRDSSYSFSYKINYVTVIKNFLNPKGHHNRISGSKVTVILLKGWILPIGGASAVEGLLSTGLPRLVFKDLVMTKLFNKQHYHKWITYL